MELSSGTALDVQPGAALRRDIGDLFVIVGLGPDEVVRIIRVVINVISAQLLSKIVQLVVFPAVEDGRVSTKRVLVCHK